MCYETGENSIRPTIGNFNNHYVHRYPSVDGIMAPNGLSTKELDEYAKEKSGEVITYKIDNIEEYLKTRYR